MQNCNQFLLNYNGIGRHRNLGTKMSFEDDSLDCPRDRAYGQAIIGNPRYSHVRAKPMLGVIGKYASHNSEDCSVYR